MLLERADKTLTNIESCNIDFIEKDFYSKGEVAKSYQLYEMKKIAKFSTLT